MKEHFSLNPIDMVTGTVSKATSNPFSLLTTSPWGLVMGDSLNPLSMLMGGDTGSLGNWLLLAGVIAAIVAVMWFL